MYYFVTHKFCTSEWHWSMQLASNTINSVNRADDVKTIKFLKKEIQKSWKMVIILYTVRLAPFEWLRTMKKKKRTEKKSWNLRAKLQIHHRKKSQLFTSISPGDIGLDSIVLKRAIDFYIAYCHADATNESLNSFIKQFNL